MSFASCNTENQDSQVYSPVRESFASPSTTSQTQFDLESPGNYEVLNTDTVSAPSRTRPTFKKPKPKSNHAVLTSYQDFHLRTPTSPRNYSPSTLPPYDDGNLRNKSSKPKKNDSKVCRFYHKYAFCQFGANCRFLHEERSTKANDSTAELFDTSALIPPDQKSSERRHSRPICRYFKHYGNCDYGESCKYEHIFTPEEPRQRKTTVRSGTSHRYQKDTSSAGISADSNTAGQFRVTNAEEDVTGNGQQDSINLTSQVPTTESKNTTVSKRTCRFFKQYGTCKYGDRCKYQHRSEIVSKSQPDSQEVSQAKSETTSEETEFPEVQNCEIIVQVESGNNIEIKADSAVQKPLNHPKPLAAVQVHNLEELTNEDLNLLRQTEITQLKKRFPRCQVLQDDDYGSEFLVEFVPSDPDWPFDVKLLELKVFFPSDYPVKPSFVEVVDTKDCFPETLIRSLDRNFETWIKNRHEETSKAKKVELVFKPFLRWLDRNLEDLFIAGLRKVKKEQEAEAAGIQFVPYETLHFAPNIESSVTPSSPGNEAKESPVKDVPKPAETSSSAAKSKVQEDAFLPSKKGTEIVLRDLEFGDNAATIVCHKIALMIQCGRCKNRNDIESPSNRANKIFCTKCHHVQTLNFRPQLMHQFGCVMGYLDLTGCQIVDMPIVNCQFDIGCMTCSKTMPFNGLHYGQHNHVWCSHCNSKMSIFVNSVKFQQLQPAFNQGGKLHSMKLEYKDKKVKDPAIQEGKPLPSNGTCKHFKKSFRWLRFPCCGKAYPCDVCHNEVEFDHDMKYATRMICGFCAKEQPFANERECVLCKSSMTKKNSTHWEGGKGCRDKAKMSRDDQHKYAGTNKTVSKKTQEKKKPAAKK